MVVKRVDDMRSIIQSREVVEKWDLDNFPEDVTPETFPSTPLSDSDALIIWLSREINSLVAGTEEVPNE